MCTRVHTTPEVLNSDRLMDPFRLKRSSFFNSALRVEELQEKQASDKDEKINDFFKSLSSIILPGFVKVKTRASGRMKPSLLHGSVS